MEFEESVEVTCSLHFRFRFQWKEKLAGQQEKLKPKKAPEIPGVHLSYLLFLNFFKMEQNNNKNQLHFAERARN